MTSIRRKSRNVLVTYQLIALAIIALTIAVTWFTVARPDNAQAAPLTVQVEVPAPTATPENLNHCMMLTDGICYIVFPSNCVPGTPEVYGPESIGVPVTCGTVKGK